MAGCRSFDVYPAGLVPGPTTVAESVLGAYGAAYASGDLEERFFEEYAETQRLVRRVLGAAEDIDVVIQSGEAMVCLWGAMKSVLRPGDRVLCVATGLYGYGFADMARSLGADVRVVGLGYDEVIREDGEQLHPAEIARAMAEFSPLLVTVVHCETPSGTLNPLRALGQLARSHGALFYVDFVSSGGACPVDVSDCCIDLGLLGSQKALSLHADSGICTVSPRAWPRIEEVKYPGYDALLPWKGAVEQRLLPYTPNWAAVRALRLRCRELLDPASGGMEAVYQRHTEVAGYCRARLRAMGVRIFPRSDSACSPSVTAALVPDGWTWDELDRRLRDSGVVFGGSYGELKGRVFRVGHMGSQARIELVKRAMDVLESILKKSA